MHIGKVCGPDGLLAEHPSLVVHLKLLFSLLFLQGRLVSRRLSRPAGRDL